MRLYNTLAVLLSSALCGVAHAATAPAAQAETTIAVDASVGCDPTGIAFDTKDLTKVYPCGSETVRLSKSTTGYRISKVQTQIVGTALAPPNMLAFTQQPSAPPAIAGQVLLAACKKTVMKDSNRASACPMIANNKVVAWQFYNRAGVAIPGDVTPDPRGTTVEEVLSSTSPVARQQVANVSVPGGKCADGLVHRPTAEMVVRTSEGTTCGAAYVKQPSMVGQVLGASALMLVSGYANRIAYGDDGYYHGGYGSYYQRPYNYSSGSYFNLGRPGDQPSCGGCQRY